MDLSPEDLAHHELVSRFLRQCIQDLKYKYHAADSRRFLQSQDCAFFFEALGLDPDDMLKELKSQPEWRMHL